MAGVFDIELHDGDSINQDESDDDIVENREVRVLFKILLILSYCNKFIIYFIFFRKNIIVLQI